MKVFPVTLSTIWSDTVRMSACFFHIITKPYKNKIVIKLSIVKKYVNLKQKGTVVP